MTIKTAWFKAGKLIENNSNHQGVVDMNNYINKNKIQKHDIINVMYVLSGNEWFYILVHFKHDSETIL